MEEQLARKTYIAIHTYMSDEAKTQMLTTPYEEDKQTDVEWEKRWTFDKCRCVEGGWEMMTSSFVIGNQKKNKTFMMP
jgi:hypothetical protein